MPQVAKAKKRSKRPAPPKPAKTLSQVVEEVLPKAPPRVRAWLEQLIAGDPRLAKSGGVDGHVPKGDGRDLPRR